MQRIKNRIQAFQLVPVVSFTIEDEALGVMNALIKGGLPCVEVTYRTDFATTAINLLTKSFPDACVGAGTVLTVEQASEAITAGAKFIVSPGFDEKIVDFCLDHNVFVIPGCATATEIMRAYHKGLNVVKFFPSEQMGGVATIKALSAPFKDVQFVPSGGLNENNFVQYLKCKEVFACSGSWMANKSMIENKDYDRIEKLTENAVKIIMEVRQHS